MRKIYILGIFCLLFGLINEASAFTTRQIEGIQKTYTASYRTIPSTRRTACVSKHKGLARVTAYNPHEKDRMKVKRGRRYVWRWIQWGRRTSSGIKAIQGITCAAAKKFPMHTKVYFPKLKGIIGDGVFEVQDRGGGEKRLHTSDWFDIFCDNKYVMNKIKYGMPEWLEYQILTQ